MSVHISGRGLGSVKGSTIKILGRRIWPNRKVADWVYFIQNEDPHPVYALITGRNLGFLLRGQHYLHDICFEGLFFKTNLATIPKYISGIQYWRKQPKFKEEVNVITSSLPGRNGMPNHKTPYRIYAIGHLGNIAIITEPNLTLFLTGKNKLADLAFEKLHFLDVHQPFLNELRRSNEPAQNHIFQTHLK